jgi:DUF1680 family protein
MITWNRRELGTALLALLARPSFAQSPSTTLLPRSARALPLSDVRLLPSDYATAVEVNRTYLLQVSPDRLLHNFRKYAGLEPKAPIYGGWESDTIAGHTLGHYMSALVLMHAQTGDRECRRRADYIVGELAEVQAKRGTGGFTYMTPLMTGAPREYSKPADDPFWCCVGTGMESHAKHGVAIFWEGNSTLLVNMFGVRVFTPEKGM